MNPTGYAHPQYAAALAEFGEPLLLRRSGAVLLRRWVPDSSYRDATGCYPLLACPDWLGLADDLADLREEVVSVVAVLDPFAPINAARVAAFSHGAVPYKDHFVVDLSRDLEQFVHPQHRRKARRALEDLNVEVAGSPRDWLDEWCGLYDCLIERHDITGINAFSHASFAHQFEVPGLTALRATEGGETIGMILWFVGAEAAYYHLAAYSPRGYELNASFALFWESLRLFRSRVHWLGLGAGAGVTGDGGDGLTRFKRGWASGTRTAYLARHVADAARYAELCRERAGVVDFFPAYRAPEARRLVVG